MRLDSAWAGGPLGRGIRRAIRTPVKHRQCGRWNWWEVHRMRPSTSLKSSSGTRRQGGHRVTTRIVDTETGEGGMSVLAAVARSPVAWAIDIYWRKPQAPSNSRGQGLARCSKTSRPTGHTRRSGDNQAAPAGPWTGSATSKRRPNEQPISKARQPWLLRRPARGAWAAGTRWLAIRLEKQPGGAATPPARQRRQSTPMHSQPATESFSYSAHGPRACRPTCSVKQPGSLHNSSSKRSRTSKASERGQR